MEGLSSYNIVISLVGGILSFLSPCVFPLVPGYVSMISGVSIDKLTGEEGNSAEARRAVIINSLAFNIGISIVFLSLGATAGLIGAALINNFWVRVIGGLIIILFGLQMMGFLKIGALYKDTRFFGSDKPAGIFGSFTLGLAFAAGWTPCIGPILGGIIGLAATSGGWQSGLVLSAFYSLGLAIPFLLVGLFINQFLGFSRGFRKHLHTVEIISGLLLIVIGLLIASGNLAFLNSPTVAKYLPNIESLVKLDESKTTSQTGGQTPSNQDFKPAPNAVFQNLDGTEISLSELKGKVVLLNFWATWCIPCRKEIPALNELHKQYEAQGFTVVGVSHDDTAEMVRDFQKEIPMDYKVLVGGDKFSEDFGLVGFPTTFVIDRDGRIREKILGEKTKEQFEEKIKSALAASPQAK